MTCSESYTIEKHAQLVFISAFLSPYDELFNIKQNFKMKKYMPLEGLRWSRDSGSALYDTPQTAVLGRAGGLVITGDDVAVIAWKGFQKFRCLREYNSTCRRKGNLGEPVCSSGWLFASR